MADGGLSKNDPYREMETGKDEIKPGFLGGVRDWADNVAYRLNGEEYDKDGRKIKKRKAAGNTLGAGEKAAAGEGSEFSNNLSGMRERESAVPGIINSVKGRSGKDSSGKGRFSGKGKLKGKGFLRKAGPIAIIGGIFAVVAGIMVGAQNVMPIAIEEMIIEKLNSIGISSTMASDEWLDTQLNQGVRQGNPKSNEPETTYAFSEYQVQQFKKYGVTVVNGDGIVALLYEKDGQYIPVVGSAALGSMSESEIISKIQSASKLNNIGTPVSAKEALADSAFKNPYATASKAWRGGASGWFDNIMEDLTEVKLNIGRNRWNKWASHGIEVMKKTFAEVAKTQSKIKDDGVVADEEVTEEYEDENGQKKTKTERKDITSADIEEENGGVKSEELGSTEMENVVDGDNVSGTKEKIAGVLNSKALKVATDATDVGCAIAKGFITIYSVVAAEQKLQFLNLISGFLEAVDKVKAGDDTGSPIHVYGENLTKKADTLDDDGKVAKKGRTAMEAAGMAWLFANNSSISQKDSSVRNVNFESIMSNISWLTNQAAFTTSVYVGCSYASIAGGLIDLASTVLSVATAGGIGAIKDLIVKPVLKQLIKSVAVATLKIIIPIAAKNYAKMLLNDVATEWLGEDLGNALISGANMYLGGNGASGGQGPGSKDKLLAYLGRRDTVIAEEAEYQRAMRSPFDTTSRYTFLGNLAYSIMPLAYSGGITTDLFSVAGLLSSSVRTMLPTASAVENESVLNSSGDCTLLESAGGLGDAFCNPHIITDVSTMETSPVAVSKVVHDMKSGDIVAADGVYSKVGSGNFNDDGSIKDGSNLAKYVTYCGQRTSQYGLYDAAITADLTGENSTASSIIGIVPGLDDLQNIIQGGVEIANQNYITGKACVASDEDYWENENKWYQRYAENERLLENMNPGYTSEITAYLDKHYMENPMDQSYEGTLARFSGMSVEDVEYGLALIEYYNFLENYNPSERYAFGEPAVEEEKELRFDNENSVAENVWVVLLNQISYADVRNRNFAV